MPSPRGLLRSPLRPPAPDADPDAELLGRYVVGRTEEAFAALVRRHGPMVLGVCRRRLGPTPDADDAFQVTFMLLARDAARIGSRESLPGWLYRVAHLVALKMSGTRGRRRTDPLPDDPAGRDPEPATDAEVRELRAALDEELAALPDKLRAVVVLCGLEERSNAEAARLLGCPTGTVDSRLSAARQKLRARLARRGWPVPAVAALDALLRTPPASASGASALFGQTVRAAVGYAASGGAAADPLSTFANGVTTAMSSANAKLLISAGMSLAVFATAGLGLLGAPAGDGPKPKPPAAAKAEPKKEAPPPRAGEPATGAAGDGVPVLKDDAGVRRALAQEAPGVTLNEISLRDLLDLLHRTHGVNARIDTAAFKRWEGVDVDTPINLYDEMVRLPVTRGMTVGDLLSEACAQLSGRVSFRVRGSQVVIVPAYVPPTLPGIGSHLKTHDDYGAHTLRVTQSDLVEDMTGPALMIEVAERPLAEVLKEIRTRTGANIVLDNRCTEPASQRVSGTFDDVRLYTVLTVLSDMCGLKTAYSNNVYYVTTPENADRIQKEYLKSVFPIVESPPTFFTPPPGYVTDGMHLYVKPKGVPPVAFDPRVAPAGNGLPGPLPPGPPTKDTKPE